MKTGRLERYALAMLLGLSASAVVGQNATETEVPTDDMMPGDDGNATAGMFPTEAPTVPTMPPTGEGGCYYSLDAVYSIIKNDDLLFQQKRFVICAGSIMDVGFLVPGVGIDQGQAPIIPRSNTEFLCGEDGKSENNCVIKGGDFGLIAVPVFFRQDLTVNNVLVKGFTFEGQVQYAIFVASAGDITFEDCIFRDSANFGPMVYNYDKTLDLGRRLVEDEDEPHDPWAATIDYINKYREGTLPNRRLTADAQEEEDTEDSELLPQNDRGLQGADAIHKGVVKDCLFTNLQQVERKLGVEFGVVSIKGPDHDILIQDCTFSNNQYGNQELTPIGYAILCQQAALTLDGVCFVDNDFRGSGVVLLERTANPFVADADFFTGNYATEDDNVDCQFAAYFATDEDRRNSNFTCVPVQTDECGGEPVDVPVVAPSPTPNGEGGSSEATSGAPSQLSHMLLAGLAVGISALFQ